MENELWSASDTDETELRPVPIPANRAAWMYEDDDDEGDNDNGDDKEVEEEELDEAVQVDGAYDDRDEAGGDSDYDDEEEEADHDAPVPGCGLHTHLAADFEEGVVFSGGHRQLELACRAYATSRGVTLNVKNNLNNSSKNFIMLCACAKKQKRKPKNVDNESISIQRNKKPRIRKPTLKKYECLMRIIARPVDKDEPRGALRITKSVLGHNCRPSRRQQEKVGRYQGVQLTPSMLIALSSLCIPSVRIKTSQMRDWLHEHDIGVKEDSKAIRNLIFRVRRCIATNKVVPPVDDLLSDLKPSEVYAFFGELWAKHGNDESINPLVLAMETLKTADDGMCAPLFVCVWVYSCKCACVRVCMCVWSMVNTHTRYVSIQGSTVRCS
jgi:hypothetical protein